MIRAFLLSALAAIAPPGTNQTEQVSSPRWEWRVCTRNSADSQLRARRISLEYESVVRRAFEECRSQMAAVDRTQSADDIERLQEQQSRLIRQDVEIYYWDHMTGHI